MHESLIGILACLARLTRSGISLVPWILKKVEGSNEFKDIFL